MMNSISRRKMMSTVVLGTVGVSGSFFAAPLALARTGEDPVAIITGFANDLFALFTPLNGVSNSYGSRRRALAAVVEERFAYDQIAETAAAIAVLDMSAAERARLHGIGKDLAIEVLLSFFSSYTDSHQFIINGARNSRSGNRTILETTLITSGGSEVPIRWDIVQVGSKCKVLDVRVLGISLINDVAQDAYNAYERDGVNEVFKVLDRRVRNLQRERPN